MMADIWDFFENMDELVYVADMDTYDMVYMNRRAMAQYALTSPEQYQNRKCYELLQSCSSPCAMCTNSKLCPGDFFEWSRYNPIVKRAYILKDTMVIRDGRRLRIEITIDMNVHQREKLTIEDQTDTKALIKGLESGKVGAAGLDVIEDEFGLYYKDLKAQCLRKHDLSILRAFPNRSIDILLQYMGQSFSGERAYIFERNSQNSFDNTFEWYSDQVLPQKNILLNIPEQDLNSWVQAFNRNENVLITDIEAIRTADPDVYSLLKPQNIHSLVVSPIMDGRRLIGFYGIDNPPLELMSHISFTLQLFGHFISSILKRRDLVERLENLSFYDQLTGAKNRHAMNEFLSVLPIKTSLGILYADVMGLKQINDTQGHQAGDQTLIRCCRCLMEHFPKNTVFRVGGDEFLILCENWSQMEFEHAVNCLKNDMIEGVSFMAVGSVWLPCCDENVEKYISDADSRMYENKRAYYQSKGHDRRKRRE